MVQPGASRRWKPRWLSLGGELAPQERAGAFRRFQGHPGCSGGGRAGGAGKGTRKRSRSGKVTKWRVLIYCRSLCSFPATEKLPRKSGMRGWGPLRAADRAEPTRTFLRGLRQRHPTAPVRTAATARKGWGCQRKTPEKNYKITQARVENNGVINKPQSESDEIARRLLPINSKLYNIQVLGQAVVL